jgi:hypothetical protein
LKKLTIVVNCTDRKSQVAAPYLRLGSVPSGDLDMRFKIWRRRIEDASATRRLVDLYQGEAWQQARGLAEDAGDYGFGVTLLVASAGLGLRDAYTFAPAYGATFAGGQPDSVGSGQIQTRDWWKRLSTFKASQKLSETVDKRLLLVLSESYARAMDDDLIALAARGGDLLLIGGARTIPGLPRLAADRSLRRQLGGTASSLTLRMARAWLSRRSHPALHNVEDRAAWEKWARLVSHTELYDRSPMTDPQLSALIRKLKAADPTLSATRALRRVRDAGIACEQKRFGQLFREAVSPSCVRTMKNF